MARPWPTTCRPNQSGVIEADYVVLEAAIRADPPQLFPRSGSVSGIAMLGRRERPPEPQPRRGGPAFWLFGLLLAGAAFWTSGGHAMLDKAPRALSWAAADRLRIEDVRSRVENVNGRALLFVEGRIANRGAAKQPTRTLSVAVASRSGRVAHHNLGTSGLELAPGESFVFSGRFAAPMEGAESVSVSFGEN